MNEQYQPFAVVHQIALEENILLDLQALLALLLLKLYLAVCVCLALAFPEEMQHFLKLFYAVINQMTGKPCPSYYGVNQLILFHLRNGYLDLLPQQDLQ